MFKLSSTILSGLAIVGVSILSLASPGYSAPTTPPPGGYTGGIFSVYFKNIVQFNGGTGMCPAGQGIVGFTTGSTSSWNWGVCIFNGS